MPLALSTAGTMFGGAGDRNPKVWEVFSQWTAGPQSLSHHYANASETWNDLEIWIDLRFELRFSQRINVDNAKLWNLFNYTGWCGTVLNWEMVPPTEAKLLKPLNNQFISKNVKCLFSQKCTSKGVWDDSAGKGVQH